MSRQRPRRPVPPLAMHNAKSPSSQAALKQYKDTDGHFSLVRLLPPLLALHLLSHLSRNFRLADLVTIMNGVCGSFSIFSSAQYLVTHDPDYLWTALSFPLAGLMFDFFDGKVARWRKSSSLLGQELDSLADLVIYIYTFSSTLSCSLQDIFWSGPCSLGFRCWPTNVS